MAQTKNPAKPRKRVKWQGHKSAPVNALRAVLIPVCFTFVGTVLAISFALNTDLIPIPKDYLHDIEYLKVMYRKFTHLSYYDAKTDTYGTGIDDVYFVLFAVAWLTLVRWLLSIIIFKPLGRLCIMTGNIRKKQKEELKVDKFAEQGWQLVWYSLAWTIGFYQVYTWNFDYSKSFNTHPNPVDQLGKYFYLIQCAFWIHMIPVTLLEPWRGDFAAMMAHHVITSSLIASSYFMGYTIIGTFILAEQDLADVFLPLAKMFKYSNCPTMADIIFAIFSLVWIPTRHGIFIALYIHIVNNYIPSLTAIGVYPNWDPENRKFATAGVYYGFLIVLGLFQMLLLTWLRLILIAVYKALTTSGDIEDQRSDSETDDLKED